MTDKGKNPQQQKPTFNINELLSSLAKSDEIEKLFLRELATEINSLYGMILYDRRPNRNTEENFELLRRIAQLSGEILDKSENEKNFEIMLQTSKEDGDHYREKISTFRMLRNLLVHFPIFKTWDDIFISKKLLHWNSPNNSSIEKYFNNNQNKQLSFTIYTRHDYSYDKCCEFNLLVPQLKNDEKLYLKDILPIESAMWLFALIGYYLEWKNFKINPDESYMGAISA